MKAYTSNKFKLFTSVAGLILSTAAYSLPVEPKTVFQRPFITGASVSADWSTKSPGKTLALRYTDESQIKTVAIGGRTGKEMIRQINESQLKDRTIILAIDFLFWDSTDNDFTASHQALEKLVGYASARKIPIVLGEIPELLPGRQTLREKLNNDIKKTCSSYAGCYVMPFDSIHRQALKDGYLSIKDRKYKIKELVPDGLHLSQPATEFLADTMLNLLNSGSGKNI
jgi:hypothetical protein